MKRVFLYLIIILFTQSCSKKIEQDEAEKLISKRLDAEEIQISFNNDKSTTNGKLVSESSYLLVEVFNSSRFENIKNNDRLFNLEADKLKRFISDSVQFNFNMDYNDLRIDIINRKNFLFFNKKDTRTVTYENL